ncbi:PKD domain-containing protein [Luteolibacter yonseiensis]|uniref:PKD domain-containing protein n=1 Tax=Luteolibacter yonseiensis TaxID=1144680 RepID=A0A934VB17_9BACT|nr:PKD domain-containing protein [Luteolibacter yonseiensis]MBK1816788.1 PKD domain-containing protein [Luteolibacter yonseiensis]
MNFRKHISLLLGLALLAIVTLLWLGRTGEKPSLPLVAHPQGKNVVSVTEEVFSDFSRWLEDQARADTAGQMSHEATGLQLARARRVAMETLIRTDPRRALEQAVTLDVWKKLPPEIQAEVEEPFSTIANYRVFPVCVTGSPDPAGTKEIANFPDATRWTEIEGGPTLESHVFGRRSGLDTKEKSPVQGIRIGSLAALREGIFHQPAPDELSVMEKLYPLANPFPERDFATGQDLGPQPVTVVAGGKIFKFADMASFQEFNKALEAMDEKPGPHTGAGTIFLPKASDGAGGFNLVEAIALNNQLASAWTETKKKVFMIRCDFSDKTNASFPVVNAGTYGALLNTTVSDNIRNYSYGKTWIEATVSATITRLPQPSSYYDDDIGGGTTRNSDLLSNAKAAYQAANPAFVPSSYDIIGVWFVNIAMKSGGLEYAGLAGGADLWIQGTSSADVHVHEFGHNYGLGHSSFWTPPVASTNPVDPAGTSEEYGDVFDVMGDGPLPEGAFHSQAKQRLNWLATGEWTDATASGSATHRLYQIDDRDTTGVRGLRVTKATGEYYWLSYRRLFANNWLRAGANVVWQRPSQTRSWLIDTTPTSLAGTADRTDGSIAIGRTFSNGNTHITPLARGGDSPQEYLDVRVNIGPFPGNVAPTVSLRGPSTLAARQTSLFIAEAADGNGDELAYSWDFGQGFTFDNHPIAPYAWNSGGTYTVKVTVSDMKGNTAQATKTVTVADPITTWTARANSSTGDFNALAASTDKVIAVGEDYSSGKGPVATSIDGVTWNSHQLGNNQHMSAMTWDGAKFLLAGQEYNFDISDWVGCILTSPTGNSGSWTRRLFTGPPLSGIAYGGGVYVVISDDGTVRRSTDGITWSAASSVTTSYISGLSYGGGKFVAVGRGVFSTSGNGVALTSPDGITWTDTSGGAGLLSWQDLRHVHWAGDRFFASGFYSKLRHSTDLGTTFTSTRTPLGEDAAGVAYGNGVWFAAATDWENSGVDIDLVSSDGANWTNLTTPALDDRNAAIFFNNTFITAGRNHSIRQSGIIAPNANGYYAWRETQFPDHGPLSTPDGDSDADSISNLMEYALGRSPLASSGGNGASALPQGIVAGEPLLNDRISLLIDMPQPAAPDLTYIIEGSSTLVGSWTPIATKVGTGIWTWNAGGTSRIVTGSPVGGRAIVKIGDAVPLANQPARFLRMRTQVNQ